jgi:hypothetical protein
VRPVPARLDPVSPGHRRGHPDPGAGSLLRRPVGVEMVPTAGVEQAMQDVRLDRLDEVEVEAGLLRPAAVVLLAQAGQGDHQDAPAPGLILDRAGHFVVGDVGQADVQQDDVRSVSAGDLDRLAAVERGAGLVWRQASIDGCSRFSVGITAFEIVRQKRENPPVNRR